MCALQNIPSLSVHSVTAGILSTGTEILQGLYADTNAEWLSERLTQAGLDVRYHLAAPDDADAVASALEFLLANCQLVIMSGGLGPTDDDLTRDAVCRVFRCELCEDPRAWDMICQRFARRSQLPSPLNRVQALIPSGAVTLYNNWGTAPGFWLETPDGKCLAALPGPPLEMKPMFETYLEREIQERFGRGHYTSILTLHTFGLAESRVNEMIRPLFEETRHDPDRTIAFLATEAKIDIRLTVRGNTPGDLRKRLVSLVSQIHHCLPKDLIYGRGDETMESVVSDILRRRHLKMVTAESCTGGLIAKRLTDLSGSSDVFLKGYVTYSDDAKKEELGVSAATLERYGAVSAETAAEMATGALAQTPGADLAVSVTGIAGPTGGTADKPVGLVCYGLAWRETVSPTGLAEPLQSGINTTRTVLSSTRPIIRAYAANRALDLVRRLLLGLDFDLPR